MAIDYMEVMGTLGSIAARHPQTMSLAMQTYSMYSQYSDEISKMMDEYKRASAQATGKFDIAGILMQICAMHPNGAKVLLQIIAMWQGRIPDLIQIINEFQDASVAAQKT